MRSPVGRFAIGVAAASTIAASIASDAPIEVLAGREGGAYYSLAVVYASEIGKALPNVKTTVQAVRSPVESLDQLQAARATIAFAPGDTLADARDGNPEAGFKGPLDHIRAIGALYPSYLQIVARADAGVRSIADLKGKRLSVGMPNSPIELDARAILAAAGLRYKDFAKALFLPFGESVELIRERQIDATLQLTEAGASSLRDLASSVDIVLVDIPADVVANVKGRAFESGTIAARTYKGQDADVTTAIIRNYVVTHEGVAEDTAYAVTKALWSGAAQLAAAHRAAKGLDRVHALDAMPIPLHAGAVRYYREAGILK